MPILPHLRNIAKLCLIIGYCEVFQGLMWVIWQQIITFGYSRWQFLRVLLRISGISFYLSIFKAIEDSVENVTAVALNRAPFRSATHGFRDTTIFSLTWEIHISAKARLSWPTSSDSMKMTFGLIKEGCQEELICKIRKKVIEQFVQMATSFNMRNPYLGPA